MFKGVKMIIRARNAVWVSKRAIGIRDFGVCACGRLVSIDVVRLLQKDDSIAMRCAVRLMPSLCSPNEDFGTSDQKIRRAFSRYFSAGVGTSLGYDLLKKSFENARRIFWSDVPKSSFGEHKVVTKDHSIP